MRIALSIEYNGANYFGWQKFDEIVLILGDLIRTVPSCHLVCVT